MRKTALAFALIAAGLAGCTYPERLIEKGSHDWTPYAERRCQELNIAPGDEFDRCVTDKARRRYALVTCTVAPGWMDMDPGFCASAE